MERVELSKLFVDEPRSVRQWSGRGAVALAGHPTQVAGVYLAAIVVAELTVVFGSATVGVIADGLILLALLSQYALLTQMADRDRLGRIGGVGLPWEAERFRRALPAFSLLPLLRILSVVMPVRAASPVGWYVLVGAPLLLACLLAMRALVTDPRALGLHLRGFVWQIPIAMSGLPLAVLAYAVARPRPLIAHPTPTQAILAALSVIVFSALVEELIFRSLLQAAMISLFGPLGLVWSALLFASFYLGALSPAYVLIMYLTGLFYGWCVSRTGSLGGVIGSHGLVNVGALLVLPLIWR